MELQEAISKRRSIRKFTDYYVTDSEINTLIEAAIMAPSWANTQVWSFIIVRDKHIIERIAETYPETNPARKCSLAATAMIAVCAQKGVSGCRQGHEITTLHNWLMFDTGLAVQNICLKAHEIGLGTVIVGLFDHDKCKDVLSLPEDQEVVVILPVGKPVEGEKKATPRKPVNQITYIDKFGELYIK